MLSWTAAGRHGVGATVGWIAARGRGWTCMAMTAIPAASANPATAVSAALALGSAA